MDTKKEIKEKITIIINHLKREFPGIKSAISLSDPLDVLIATILSQNTTDKTSYKAYLNLKKKFKTWKMVMDAPLREIQSAIRVCGLGKQKSISIKNLLLGVFNSRRKLSMEYLRKLDEENVYRELMIYRGIGLKTASCVLAFSLGRDVFPVDTHVHRIVNRLGLVKTASPDKTFEEISHLIPKGKKFLFHRLLIRFGRKICRASNPLCGRCRLYELCVYDKRTYFANRNTFINPKENNFIILEHV